MPNTLREALDWVAREGALAVVRFHPELEPKAQRSETSCTGSFSRCEVG
jgi:hypothetical protein